RQYHAIAARRAAARETTKQTASPRTVPAGAAAARRWSRRSARCIRRRSLRVGRTSSGMADHAWSGRARSGGPGGCGGRRGGWRRTRELHDGGTIPYRTRAFRPTRARPVAQEAVTAARSWHAGRSRAKVPALMTAPVVYDPYAYEIHEDPYPTYKRLRDEAPAYYNPHLDFYALSRFHDVWNAIQAWDTLSSAEGVSLERGSGACRPH